LRLCRIIDNTVPAIAFKAIAAPRKPTEREENETGKGLRIADKGFLNTAVIQSQITYIDGDAGGTLDFILRCQKAHAHSLLRLAVLRYR